MQVIPDDTTGADRSLPSGESDQLTFPASAAEHHSRKLRRLFFSFPALRGRFDSFLPNCFYKIHRSTRFFKPSSILFYLDSSNQFLKSAFSCFTNIFILPFQRIRHNFGIEKQKIFCFPFPCSVFMGITAFQHQIIPESVHSSMINFSIGENH